MSDGVLVGAVVIHHPDLFFTGPNAFGVEDAGLGDARGSAAETENDVVRELVGKLASSIFAGGTGVLLGKDLGKLCVLGIVEKAIGDEVAVLDADIAEGNHGGRGWRLGPLRKIHFSRRSRRGLRRE